jgi:hypothetical protein
VADEDEGRGLAVWTAEARARRDVVAGRCVVLPEGELQAMQSDSVCWVKEAEGADAVEAYRQHVLKETACNAVPAGVVLHDRAEYAFQGACDPASTSRPPC